MTTSTHTRLALGAMLALLGLAAPAAPAQSAAPKPRKVLRLGHPATSFQKPPRPGREALSTPDDLRRLLRGRLDDVMAVVGEASASFPTLTRLRREDVEAAAQSGEIGEGTVEKGGVIPWMAYRKAGRPAVLNPPEGLVWAGAKPFGTYVLKFDSRDADGIYHWTVTAPRPCGNLWVEVVREAHPLPPAPELRVKARDACLTQPLMVTYTLGQMRPGDEIVLRANGKVVDTFEAHDGTITREVRGLPVGGYGLAAMLNRRSPPATATMMTSASVKACAPTCALAALPAESRTRQPLTLDASGAAVHPELADVASLASVTVKVSRDGVEAGTLELPGSGPRAEYRPDRPGTYTFSAVATDSTGQKSTYACDAGPVKVTPALALFGAGYVGKERLVREEFGGGRCAPLVGAKVGFLAGLGEHAEFEGALGGKLNTRDSDNSSLFLDAAVNRVLSRGFVGAGVSLWDLTLGDTRALSALVHGGVELDSKGRFAFEVEGRVPFDQFDDLDNNYQFWAGLRIRPARR